MTGKVEITKRGVARDERVKLTCEFCGTEALYPPEAVVVRNFPQQGPRRCVKCALPECPYHVFLPTETGDWEK
jgi:hypothetical protein